ncbi:MAG: AAA family ATPase [Candidatus Caenarcaniphilales bacterium]|nr:AAA family ATPase [Candidatus Caenarcaniphilales bacterium]
MLARKLSTKIKEALEMFPCVVVLGARQVGKTTLLKMILPKAQFFDLEKLSDFDYIDSDPELFLNNHKDPLVIDEAQLCPNLFKALRVKIDEERSKTGRFLLSGSSSPLLLNQISETLAGRVAIIEIPCLSWDEALERKSSKFYDYIFSPEKFSSLKKLYERQELYELCLYGLYPEPFLKRKNANFYHSWQENYFKTYIERDIRNLFPKLEIENYRKFVQMLIQSSGDTVKYSNFASSLSVSEPTVKQYLEIAQGTFVWQLLRAFDKSSTKRLIKMPKGYLADNVLINYFNKFQNTDQMISNIYFGFIWEGFVINQIRKNIDRIYTNINYYYYRTQHKAEIDLVLDTAQGLIPIEIKSGSSFKSDQLISLKNFISEYKCKYGIVINNGAEIREIAANIYQIPAVYI